MDKTLSVRIEVASQSATKALGKLNGQAEQVSKKASGSLGKLSKGIIGVTSAYMVVKKAISAYLAQDKELSAKINATWTALGAMMAPIINTVASLAVTMVEYLNAFIKAITGSNLLANAMAKSAQSAKSIKGSLAGFDEINNIGSSSSSSYSWTDYINANIAFEALYAKMENAKENVNAWLIDVETKAKDFISRIKFLNEETGKFLSKGVELFFSGIRRALDGIVQFIKGISETIIGIFTGDFDRLKQGAQTLWNGIKGIVDGALQMIIGVAISIGGVFVEIGTAIKNVFAGIWQAIVNSFNNLKDGIAKIFQGIWSVIKGVLNTIIQGFESMINACIRGLNKLLAPLRSVGNTILKTLGFGSMSLSEISTISLPRLASGGFVDSGQLFIANEQGPELVGSMNGRTAVANNQQIIEGIKQGVLEAMQASNGNMVINLEMDGTLLTKKVVSGIKSLNRQMGGSVL